MKAGIIAAGEGSRLKAAGIKPPKPLFQLAGTALIERLIRTYIRNGITEIVCIVNETSTEIVDFLDAKRFSVPVQCIVKTTPSSLHSLFALSPYLKESRFLLSTVDSVFRESEFTSYLSHALGASSADGILAVTSYIDDDNPLYVNLDNDNKIISFSKTENSQCITGGLYVLSPSVFNEMDEVLSLGIGRLRNFLSHLVTRGYRLEGFHFSKIVDVDRIQDIRAAEEMCREK